MSAAVACLTFSLASWFLFFPCPFVCLVVGIVEKQESSRFFSHVIDLLTAGRMSGNFATSSRAGQPLFGKSASSAEQDRGQTMPTPVLHPPSRILLLYNSHRVIGLCTDMCPSGPTTKTGFQYRSVSNLRLVLRHVCLLPQKVERYKHTGDKNMLGPSWILWTLMSRSSFESGMRAWGAIIIIIIISHCLVETEPTTFFPGRDIRFVHALQPDSARGWNSTPFLLLSCLPSATNFDNRAGSPAGILFYRYLAARGVRVPPNRAAAFFDSCHLLSRPSPGGRIIQGNPHLKIRRPSTCFSVRRIHQTSNSKRE